MVLPRVMTTSSVGPVRSNGAGAAAAAGTAPSRASSSRKGRNERGALSMMNRLGPWIRPDLDCGSTGCIVGLRGARSNPAWIDGSLRKIGLRPG